MTFQYRTFAKKLEEENKSAPAPDDLFYMKQTISNACGTVALIHAVANNRDKVKLDSGFLKAFLDASAGMTPQQRAEKLEKDDSICQVHDTVAKEGQTKVRRGKQDSLRMPVLDLQRKILTKPRVLAPERELHVYPTLPVYGKTVVFDYTLP